MKEAYQTTAIKSYINVGSFYKAIQEIRFMTAEDLEGIVAKAREGKHTTFSLIKNYLSYRKAKIYLRACGAISKVLRRIEGRLMGDYLKSLDSGKPDVELLSACARFMGYAAFYEGELAIIESMRAEYRAYLAGSGHFWSSVLSEFEREDEELVDYRVADWKLAL